jgi:hypothetical protein
MEENEHAHIDGPGPAAQRLEPRRREQRQQGQRDQDDLRRRRPEGLEHPGGPERRGDDEPDEAERDNGRRVETFLAHATPP